MATPAFVQITEGAGKRLASSTYTENAQTVYDQKFIPGENYLATYTIDATNVSIATVNDHVVAFMAGASLNVRVRYIHIEQNASATAVARATFELLRLTTAGSGGSALTPAKHDTSDAASGCTAQTLPSSKGTESTILRDEVLIMRQALSATQTQPEEAILWQPDLRSKPYIIPAGAANGFAVKILNAIPGATVNIVVEFTETSL